MVLYIRDCHFLMPDEQKRPTILDAFDTMADYVADYEWKLWEFESTGRVGVLGSGYREFVDRVERSPDGYTLSWTDARELIRTAEQLIWFKYIGTKGYHDKDAPPGQQANDRVSIVMFDSEPYWEVEVKDEALLQALMPLASKVVEKIDSAY